jgi:hypothetical protein
MGSEQTNGAYCLVDMLIPPKGGGSRDIRDVLKIAKLCNPADTEEDIIRLISIHHKYQKTGKEYN